MQDADSKRSNLAILTQSHKAIAVKRRKKKDQIKEIIFDEDARREYLTGFHKRKVAKKQEAKERAKLREKRERQELRLERRRALAERAAQNAREIEKAYGATIDDEEEERTGINAAVSGDEIEEYEGEEQLATVTVVEEFDPTTLLHEPLPAPPSLSTIKGDDKEKLGSLLTGKKSKRNAKVKYQTKAVRAAERVKQRARHTEKAERAGGKASRRRKRR